MGDPTTPYDLIVVGVGPAGEKAAVQAAYFGKRVAVIERESEPGGAGVHTGTLPSKTLRESSLYLSGHRARDLYGVAVSLERDATLPRLMARKAHIAARESQRIRTNLLRHGVSYFQGQGRLHGPNEVLIESGEGVVRLEGTFILLSTGSHPLRPKGIDFEDNKVHDSDEILKLEKIPESMAVLGGGVIGCEYACMFAALGVKVTLVDAREAILPFLDGEIVDRLTDAIRNLGIRLEQGRRWTDVSAGSHEVSVTLSDGTRITTDQLLFAAGRAGNTAGLGLEQVGVAVDPRGYVTVDKAYRTSIPNILAAGDIIGFPALASVSMEQGRVAVCRAFGFAYKQAVAEVMPYGIYTIPEVGAVGETEEACRAAGVEYVVGRAPYAENARGQISGDVEGLTKIVADAKTRRLLGVHVIGERATELVHIGQAALHMGATLDLFIDMVFNFPSLAESYKYAAYDCLGNIARGESIRLPPTRR